MKKRIVLPIILVAAFLIHTLLIFPSAVELPDKHYMGAHRGNSADYVENTIEAFQGAINNSKYHFIEFDVQYTADKKMVVYHDYTLVRMQQMPFWISDLTYEELMTKSKYHIPTYREIMDVVAGKKPLNIEIKSQGNLTEDMKMADFLIDDLRQRNILNTTIITSLSIDLIGEINKKYNNRSSYSNYTYYFKNQLMFVDTGIIYYVDESTFTRQIPVVNRVTEYFREKGILKSMVSSWRDSGATYLIIHGANTRQYEALRPNIPYNSKVIIWTLDDKQYLILPDKSIWSGEIDNVSPWWEY